MKDDSRFRAAQSFSLDRPDHRLAVLLRSERKVRIPVIADRDSD
jgi:hypothetical protein